MNIKAQKNKYYPESFTSLSFGDQLLADQSFAGFLLSIRIWLIRLTIVTLLAVSAWAFFYEERVFTVASFELGWLLRILAVLPILFTFKYKSFYPLSNPWVVRFLGLGILTLSAFWLNYAQIHATPHLPLVLTLLVVILDEPLSKSIFYRYLGSSSAYLLMIWLFGFVYDDLWSSAFENTKTLFLSSGSIVITVSFVLHYAAFFHKRLYAPSISPDALSEPNAPIPVLVTVILPAPHQHGLPAPTAFAFAQASRNSFPHKEYQHRDRVPKSNQQLHRGSSGRE